MRIFCSEVSSMSTEGSFFSVAITTPFLAAAQQAGRQASHHQPRSRTRRQVSGATESSSHGLTSARRRTFNAQTRGAARDRVERVLNLDLQARKNSGQRCI